MKFGVRQMGVSFGVLAVLGTAYVAGSYVPSGGYVPGGYVQPGGYTNASGAPVDASGTTMSVAVLDSADPVITGGDAYSYSVTLTNTGASTASSVSVATTLDGSLAYVSSSGTGWSCSAAAQVVTCTRASAAVGAQPAITINVTTGTSGISATTSAVASASNASNATGSQGTTVQLVSKDATAGVYVPASSTEWSNFITRKGLSISAPDAIWLLQETSADFADATGGGLTLTATGTIGYAAAVTGWSRKGFTTSDGVAGSARSTAAGLPDPSTTAITTMFYANVATIGGTRDIYEMGPTSGSRIAVLAANQVRAFDATNSATGTNDPRAAVRPYVNKFDPTNSACVTYTNQEKLSPTFTALVATKSLTLGGNVATPPAATYLYGVSWFSAKAQISDANVKALLIALGFSIPWSFNGSGATFRGFAANDNRITAQRRAAWS